MKNRSYAVLGLGKFGRSVALELSELGCDVIAVDRDEEIVKDIASEVAYSLVFDITDTDELKKIGLEEVDAVIISVTEDLEASIMATLTAKELGVKKIIVKASNTMHGKVLEKIGADRVIYAEREMGRRVAKNLMAGNFMDMMYISSKYSLIETRIPEKWTGKNLIELNLRNRFGINVVAMRSEDEIVVNIAPDYEFKSGDIILIIGKNGVVRNIGEEYED